MTDSQKVTQEDYASDVENAWCPGCGNFGILNAVKKTLVELSLPPHQVLICSGIGQAPKLPHYLHVNTFNGLHGREVAHAVGAKLAAPALTVLVHGGDGGIYGEGGNHLLHNIRRNLDLTVCVHDNRIYGLTKGQASPTTPRGTAGPIDPYGVLALELDPLALAISQRCSFVAQSLSSDGDHLVATLKEAIKHRGFSLVNILQPCVSWDKKHTYGYYKDHCYHLEERGGHDPSDLVSAFRLATESGLDLPLGVFYKEQRPTFELEALADTHEPLAERLPDPDRAVAFLQERFR